MKTNRSLVVIVSLITATLLLTACAQPEQSSLAGDWLLTPKDKTRGLTGSIAVNIAPFRCKTNCRGDNLPDNTAAGSCQAGTKKNLLIFIICQHKKRSV
ncbi:lipoprotein [Escherichia coli]|uniref:Lipoprotein n=1 Tax=Escherichia coli TaxID=562 RepID=A0A2X1N0U3_ECOLX|nr:lipoprotein [Escherichia coli]